MNQDLTECEKKRNFGFAWQSPAGYYIPKAVDIDDAIFSFRQSIPKFSSRTLNTLEGIRTTDIDAKIIIEYGKGVDSLTTMQIRTIENFGQACGYLFDLVRNRKWNMDKKLSVPCTPYYQEMKSEILACFAKHLPRLMDVHIHHQNILFLTAFFLPECLLPQLFYQFLKEPLSLFFFCLVRSSLKTATKEQHLLL